tara:strand:+ start:4185 stop:4940 length:756 start_codon:yes stop_codon:yes gene_type:complete
MIICNSHNFAVTRAQKTGGASLELYILQSGLMDFTTDSYALEGGFSTPEEFQAYFDTHADLNYLENPPTLWGPGLKDAQTTFAELVSEGQMSADMPCIGGVRHPLKWLASLFFYANTRRVYRREQNIKEHGAPDALDIYQEQNYSTPDASWDYVFSEESLSQSTVQTALKPQVDYYPEHAQLFNIENIHDHACKFIEDKGGVVPTEKIHIRKSPNDPTYYLENLSEDRKQQTLDAYEKDLLAWEKAYSVFN